MNTFSWPKAVGFGILLWVIMFGLAWVTMGMGIFASVWTQLAIAAIAGILSYGLSSLVGNKDMGYAIGYGAVFAVVGIVLDLIVSQTVYPGLYGLWTYYVAYAVVLFAPWLQTTVNLTNPRAV